jgi:hypothetical protein
VSMVFPAKTTLKLSIIPTSLHLRGVPGINYYRGDPYHVIDIKAAIKRLYSICPAGKKYRYAAVMPILPILLQIIFTIFFLFSYKQSLPYF